MKKILVIVGTVRKNRMSKVVADWVMANVPKTEHTSFELVDLKDWPLPFFEQAQSPLSSQGQYDLELANQWVAKSKEADGFLIVTDEYNHSVPAVLKNALDYWYAGFIKHKPVAFVSYGAVAGGTRAVEHLRQICSELQLIGLHPEINIPIIWDAFNPDGTIKRASTVDHLQNMIKEIDQWFAPKSA